MREIKVLVSIVVGQVIIAIMSLVEGIAQQDGSSIMVFYFALGVILLELIVFIKTLWPVWRGLRRHTPKDTPR